jgi:hypothetical protein
MTNSVSTVDAIYAAFGAGDLPRVLSCFAPDAVLTLHGPPEHPYAGSWRGLAEAERFFAKIAETVEVLDFRVDERLPAGETVVVVGHEKGRVRRTGKTYETKWVHVFRLRGEKVVRFDEFYDSAAVVAAHRA